MMTNDEQITYDRMREAFAEGYRISFTTANDAVMTSVSFRLPVPTPLSRLPLKHAYRTTAGTTYTIWFEGNSLALYVSDNMGRPIFEAEPYMPTVGFAHGVEFTVA